MFYIIMNMFIYVFKVCRSIDDVKHDDYVALRVFLQVLCQCEGPLWKQVGHVHLSYLSHTYIVQIRGRGLAYDARISLNTDTGLLKLSLFRCAHPVQAYEEMKSVVVGGVVFYLFIQ